MTQNLIDAKETTLENGLRIVAVKRDTQIAAIHCGIKVGSIQEENKVKGIAHFIEHMLFKGTRLRNNEQLNKELEFLGGDYNAYTDYTCTVYNITILEEEIERALELLSDMLIHSNFPEVELEKEREVILAEYRSNNDDIEDFSFRMVNKYAFKNSPLMYDVIGSEKTIKSISRNDIVSFYEKYYVPNNAYLTIVSPMEHQSVLELINKFFSKWEMKSLEAKKYTPEANIHGKHTTYKVNTEQSTITYLYTFYNLGKEKELPLKILNHRLGESANSILFRELREKRGLAYDIYTHLDMTNNVKTLYIYTAVNEDSSGDAIEAINQCIEDIKNEVIKFNDETLTLMKKVLKTAVASTLEDSTDFGNYILHQCLDGESIYEFFDDMVRISNVKKEEIYSVAREVFTKPTMHVLKPKN